MNRLIGPLLALALSSAMPVLAQEQVEISADVFTVEEGRQQVVFTGEVVVKHPSVTVWAPRVVASYGEGGTTDIRNFEASGAVRLQTADLTATGERATFTPGEQVLRLSGNVRVTNASGTVNSGELVVDLASGVSTFSGGRVTGVFTAQ